MFYITGHLCLMSFDFPLQFNPLHFEYDLLFCLFNDGVLCHIGHFSWVWFGSLKCVIVLTACLVEICVMLGRELIIACIVQ